MRPEVFASLAILAASCGKATIKRIDRQHLTIESNAASVLVAHLDECPARRIEIRYDGPDQACYAALGVGASVEKDDVEYRHNLADCGREQPGNNVGGCSIDHVHWTWSGDECAPPH